jgi:hypothetical protein
MCQTYGGATGGPNDPYLIYDANQLNTIGLNPGDWNKHFKLMADIDLSAYKGTEFNIIGTDWDEPFTGVFDGNGHQISNFTYSSPGVWYRGLFGSLGGDGRIQDLGLIDPNISAGYSVGPLVGFLRDAAVITRCYVEGGFSSGDGFSIGGLLGQNWGGTVHFCYSSATVSGHNTVGGLVGRNDSGIITNCYATGSVSGFVAGGFVGWNNYGCTISMCYSTGRVSGLPFAVGGMVQTNLGTVTDSFWDFETSRLWTSEGGTGKTTDQMHTKSTFVNTGWDFSTPIWTIYDRRDYPRLWWQEVRPIADAGADQSTSSMPSLIALDGSGSFDADVNDVLTYRWRQTGGLAVTLSDANAVDPNFVPPEFGTYVFELVVSDGLFESSPDIVGIVIGNNRVPIADAGSLRYAGSQSMLDGTRSYDPDIYGISTYQWTQISGPAAVIAYPNSPRPWISGIPQTGSIQKCRFELVVSDSELTSAPDTVTVTIVPDFSSGTELYESTLIQLNPPFDPNKPSILCFSGGNCAKGYGYNYWYDFWYEKANVITPHSSDPRDQDWDYDTPFDRYADMLVVYFSRVAPDYKQPVQTTGMSTGGQPALEVGIRMNLAYADPRYTVNHVTLLDPGCDYDYPGRIAHYLASRVGPEQCWVDHYISDISEFYPGALTVEFPEPPADHGTAMEWYNDASHDPGYWTQGMYHQGLAAGYYISVVGPARNLQLNTENTEFYYVWNGIDPNGDPLPGYLEFYDEISYPGTLPEPVTLAGPNDGDFVDANGAVLTCQESRNAIRYQLLFGPDPYCMVLLASDTPSPPNEVITEFPFQQTWWTVKAHDQYGSTIYADPIRLNAEKVTATPVIENMTTGKRYPCIQQAINDSDDGDRIVVDAGIWQFRESINFKGKSITLTSTDPSDPAVVATTVIHGDRQMPVVTFSASDVDSKGVLSGFTITDGNDGIYCTDANATITNCSILGNKNRGIDVRIPTDWRKIVRITNCNIVANGGDGVYARCRVSPPLTNCVIAGNKKSGVDARQSPIITNCTIAQNELCGVSGHNAKITNCIIWANSGPQISDYGSRLFVTYSNVQGGWAGLGDISADPCFARAGYWEGDVWVDGDYHLQSQAGRWDPGISKWISDASTSLCIDAGNPGVSLLNEPSDIRNVRINMGACGGTVRASKTPAKWSLLADLTNDGTVDLVDLEEWLQNWLRTSIQIPGDLNRDRVVDMLDFALLAQDWLAETTWH